MFERTKNDSELLRASLQGNPKAFGVLVGRYQSLVCAITYSATSSVEQSEELAQEVFLRAWRSLGQLQDLGKFRAWLCSIARSTVRNWFRARRRDVVEQAVPLDAAADRPSEESGPEESAMIREQRAVVSEALGEIPESLREPLVLFYREQKSVQEVAEQFGLTENTARQRISRGRRLLREQVAHLVESTVARSRPGKAFTAAVLACLAGPAVKSSAAVVGAAHAASAAGKSAGIASLLSGAPAKLAAVAAGLALVVGGILAYRQLARAAEPVGPTVATVAIPQPLTNADSPSVSRATTEAIPEATPATETTPATVARPAPAEPTPVTGLPVCQDPGAKVAAQPPESQPRGALSGPITEAETGVPVQDALVQSNAPWCHCARTDSNGFYRFQTICQATNTAAEFRAVSERMDEPHPRDCDS
jgi:RNA polymerase sigma factor (sigma-70 family)